MDDAPAHSLAQFEPEGIAAEGQGWQQRKSAQTRVTILEAAVDCLESVGYARTTTQLIAQTAGISRGAMLHHYATKQDLIAAVIDYAFYKRMEAFLDRIALLSDEQRIKDNAGVELYWQTLLTREFTAILELKVASRTDDELREIFLPKAREYDKVERREVSRAFPEWADNSNYALAMDFVIASIEGLLLNRDIWNDRDRRVALRKLISRTLTPLREHRLDPG